MSSIQIYNDVLNQGPSLTELAANAVVQKTRHATGYYKSTLSFDMKNRIHTQWVDLKKFLENSGILQFMHMSEQHAVACLNAQDSSKAIDIADHIEEIWNIFSLHLNNLDLNNLAVNLSGPNTSPASVGVYAYCCLYRQWEKQALVRLWNVLIKQKPELPQLNTVQAIEDWFENQENSTILDTIHSLDLSYQLLLALPPQILKFSKLQSLFLSNNQLTTIPDRIGELTQLR